MSLIAPIKVTKRDLQVNDVGMEGQAGIKLLLTMPPQHAGNYPAPTETENTKEHTPARNSPDLDAIGDESLGTSIPYRIEALPGVIQKAVSLYHHYG